MEFMYDGSQSASEKIPQKINSDNTPYDDAFKTLLVDCTRLIIPVINEMFGENYTGKEMVTFASNEHHLHQNDGTTKDKRTDSGFTIHGDPMRRYHVECQSTADQTMVVRMFEYDVPIALENGAVVGNKLIVRFPHSAVIYLRHTRNTPRTMTIEMHTPGGCVSYQIPVLKTQEYDLDTIFSRKLYLLLPFYIFVYEKYLKEYEDNAAERQELQTVFLQIRTRLEELSVCGEVSEYEKCALLDMSRKVIRGVTARYHRVQEGIGDVMGGKVLEYEAKTILRKGIAQGLQEGRQEGLKEGRLEGQLLAYIGLVKDGLITLSEAAGRLEMSESELSNYL